MNFFEIRCCNDTNYAKLFKTLEKNGNFYVLGSMVILNTKKTFTKIKEIFYPLNVDIEKIDPTTYSTIDNEVNKWIICEYRKSKVEKLLKQAEKEKQEELRNLYGVIKSAEEIVRKEDLIDSE